MSMDLAAVHESGPGTTRKRLRARTSSAYRGTADDIRSRRVLAPMTQSRSESRPFSWSFRDLGELRQIIGDGEPRGFARNINMRGCKLQYNYTVSRRGRAREYAVNLGGHDEIVLMQSLDLLSLQRDRGIAPAEADIIR